ncbi:MAG: FeoB small GTPase domain-containing protein, partial [Sulfuriferula sp.]
MKRIALLGMPNTGKSTFFNRLTGAGARVGNWPGITVDLLSAKILLAGSMVEVVDLPGIYNLHGFSDDEQVVRHFLESQAVNGLVVILNATQLDRQLALLLQLKTLQLPITLVLNMQDEAQQMGIKIDLPRLSAALGVEINMISAKYGQGFDAARTAIASLINQQPTAIHADSSAFQQDDNIELELDRIVSDTVSTPVT